MTFDYTALAELYPTRSYTERGALNTSDSRLPRKPYASLWRSFRLSFSRALILRSKNKGSTASKFACCMRAEITHFLASCPLGAHSTTFATRTSPSARWPKTERQVNSDYAPQCLADELFGDIRPIRIGGVDEIDSELLNLLKGSDRLCSICGRTPDAGPGEAHRPEAETIDLDLTTYPK